MDSGTLSRVGAELLEFMNDNDNGVFVVMTANDVTQLPPELTRAGRLDAIWYFSLPSLAERKEIFKIHLSKTNIDYDESILDEAAKESEHYTGAEIEQIVKTALRKAFKKYLELNVKEISKEDLLESIKEVIPIYKSSKEVINYLENWARERCRNTSSLKNDDDSFDDKALLEGLNDDLDGDFDL